MEPVGLQLDAQGVLPESLDHALSGGCRAALLTPYAQNPTGSAWTPERFTELARVIKAYPAVLTVEDDYLSPFLSHSDRLGTTDRKHWAVIRSLSKCLGPDLRFAYFCGSPDVVQAVRGIRSFTSRWVSRIIQNCVLRVLSDTSSDILFEEARKAYSQRQKSLVDALKTQNISAFGATGINVWIPVPNEDTFSLALYKLGWAVRTGSMFRLGSPPG